MMSRRNRNTRFPILVVLAGMLLLVVAIALPLVINSRNPAGNPSAADQPASVESIPYPEIERVSLVDAKKAFDTGTAVFVDVRTAGSFSQDHIPGALSIPLGELPDRLDELDGSEWIITYCT